MKTPRLLLLLTSIAAPAALLTFGCTKSDTSATADKVNTDVKAVAADVKSAVSDSWDSIKDYTYEKRADFSACIDRMAGKFDDKTRELKAKASGASDTASKDRDSAMKEYDDARGDLKSKLSDLGNSTAATWADAKEKVAQAWKRVQAAYDKATSDSAS